MACKTERTGLLRESDIQQIVSIHDADFIYGLDYSKQRQVVNSISEDLYRRSLTGKVMPTDINQVVSNIESQIGDKTEELNSAISTLTANNSKGRFDSKIAVLQENLSANEAALKNMPKLVTIARDGLAAIEGLEVKVLDIAGETLGETEQEIESGIERTTFSEDFSLELNSKDTASSRLKKFLSTVDDYTFENGKLVKSASFFGGATPLNFNYVYKELHRMLEGVEATQEAVLRRLENLVENTLNESNNNHAWLPAFVDYFKGKDVDNQIRREFVSDMSKHKVNMSFVQYKNNYHPIDNYWYETLRMVDDNSASTAQRILTTWKKNHLNSDVIIDNKYSGEIKDELINEMAAIRKLPTNIEQGKRIQKVLSRLGVNLNSALIESLFVKGGKFYYGKNSKATAKLLTRRNGILDRVLNNIPEDGTSSENTQYITRESLFKGMSNASGKFTHDEFDNVFRVGDKLIATYTNNHYTSNRTRDLKNGYGLIDKLQKTLFAGKSLYLELMADRNDSTFKNWFNIDYVSLNPLKKGKRKRSDKSSKLSPLDMEVVKLGMFNSQTKYSPIEINGVTHHVRDSIFFFPTLSDKSRILQGKGIAIDSTRRVVIDDKPTVEFKSSSVKLFYDSIVQPEIERINISTQSSFTDNVHLESYNGGLFYLLPSLNSLMVKEPGTETERLFLDVVKGSHDIHPDVEAQVLNHIRDEVLDKAVETKMRTWESLGISTADNNGIRKSKYIESIKTNTGNKRVLRETAMDFVYNNMLFNTNMFQLIVGDPAQYFKRDVSGTYSNIGKRLAAEVAPGIEMEGPDYIQLYAHDREVSSDYFEEILKTLDNKTLEEFQSMSLDKQKSLKAFPYSEIESTDAQEYTTWKEHLNILLYRGRISDLEHAEASKAFSEGRNPSKKVFKEVMQPMKPVYAYNDPTIAVGETTIDRKTYIKSSSFPLLPTLTKGTELEKLRLQMEKIESKSGKGVRLAYKTAAKVGFPSDALTIWDDNGDFQEFEVTDSFLHRNTLSRKGFRIQQDKPYDAKSKDIKSGSQEKKLMWANILGLDFEYNGETISGESLHEIYIDTYKKLYENGLDKLNSRITDTSGNVDIEMLSDMLRQELKRRGETSKPLLDGLDIIDRSISDSRTNEVRTIKDFKTPLWLSPYADKYSSLISSIVKTNVVSHNLTGKSFILGSEEGIKTFESVEDAQKAGVVGNTGIVFTDSFTGKLKPQYVDKSGVVHPAQVILPFKFRDNNDNLLKLENFTTTVNGKTMLDMSKLSGNLLESFGFRIPTQLHSNMSYMEIVGFLPTTSGDLIIAPKEFTKQMGSDFDVDSLYAYLRHSTYNSGNNTLKRTTEVSNFSNKQKAITKTISSSRKELDNTSAYSYIVNTIKDYRESGDTVSKSGLVLSVLAKYPEEESAKKSIDTLITSILELGDLERSYAGGLHNKLLDIHISVVSNPKVQSSVLNPLGFGQYLELADQISQYNAQEPVPIISEQYQTDKFYDGTAGKDGISVFSSDSVFNSLAQRKDLVLTEMTDEGPTNIIVEFGNKYNVSDGNLSRIESQKKDNPKPKTEVIAAAQNLSVDNANEQGMFKVNMNTYTFPVYSLLNFLGFEEDISAPFISQPIIVEYVNRMREKDSILKPFIPDQETLIVKELQREYSSEEVDVRLADFSGKNASKELLSMIEQKDDYNDYGKYQVAILDKFIALKKYHKPIPQLQQLLNIDSKGFHKNMYEVKKRYRNVQNLHEYSILNADKLIGEYIEDTSNGFPMVSISPTTLAGMDNMLGAATLVDTFSEFFLESNPGLRFDEVVSGIAGIVTDTGELSSDRMNNVRESYKSFLLSNFSVDNVNILRKHLFSRKDKGSLYDKLKELKKSGYWANNLFLNSIEFSFVEGILNIDFNNVSGDSFDDTALYLSFIDLFRQNGEINDVIPSILGEELISYSLLRGGVRAKKFIKFVPAEVLSKFINIPKSVSAVEPFVDQWIRHNAEAAPTVFEYKKYDNGKAIKPTDGKSYGPYITIENKKSKETILYKLENPEGDTGLYKQINQLGDDNFDEYSVKPVNLSVKVKNNKVREAPTKLENRLVLGVNDNQSLVIKNTQGLGTTNAITVANVQDSLNFDSAQELIKSIGELSKFPQQAELAKIISSTLPNNTKLNVENSNRLSYTPSMETINIGTKRLESYSNKQVLESILHEFMHAVTSENIDLYLQNSKLLATDVREAIINLNTYKNAIIKNMNASQQTVFQNVTISYLSGVSKSKLQNLMKDTTVSGTIQQWVQRVYEFKNGQDLDGSIQEMIKEANNASKNYDAGIRLAYYSLLNLKEFVAVSSTSGNTREALIGMAGKEYTTMIGQLFEAILKALGFDSKSDKGIIQDILTVADVRPDTSKEIILTDVVTRNMEEQALFPFSDGNTYFMDGNKIYNISSPSKEVFKTEGNQRNSFIRKYIDYTSNNIEYSMEDFEIDTSINFFLENPKYTAKLFKHNRENPDKQVLIEVYQELQKSLSFKPTKVVDIKEPVHTEFNKYNLPKQQESPVDLAEDAAKYATKVISTDSKVTAAFDTTMNSLLTELDKEGKEIKDRCKGIAGGTSKAAKGMRGSLSKGNEWSLVKDLKGLPSHAKGGVDLRIDSNGVSFATKAGRIKAEQGLFISNTPTKEAIKRNQVLVPGSNWNPISNYRKSKAYAENGAIIVNTTPMRPKFKGSMWSKASMDDSNMYSSNGLALRKSKDS